MLTNFEPRTLNLSTLPEKYRKNWHIYLALRPSALINFSSAVANANTNPQGEQKQWCDVFDSAAKQWLEVNPDDPVWASGHWPDGAADYLGNEPLSEAVKLCDLTFVGQSDRATLDHVNDSL
jgi:hypothetical protein